MKLRFKKYNGLISKAGGNIKYFIMRIIGLFIIINNVAFANDAGSVPSAGSAILIILLLVIIFSILMGGGGSGDD